MQKLWLRDFEHHIPAAVWQAAEKLLRNQAVRRLEEIERHFWVTTVADGENLLETEVIITPSKVKAFACECWEDGRHLICPHIAVALYKIRQYLAQKERERQMQAQAAEEARGRRLKVDNILAKVNKDDLLAFVRHYADKDPTFALALKAHFASKLRSTEDQYTAVIRSALPESTKERPLKPAEMRRARLALDALMSQLHAGDTLVAFHISLAVLQQLAPRAATAEASQREWLLNYCRQALQLLTTADMLPPEQRERTWQVLLELFLETPYPQELEPDTLRFLASMARDDEHYQHIRKHFDEAPLPTPTPVLALFSVALAERTQYAVLERILEAHLDEPTRPLAVLEMLAQLGYLAAFLPPGMALWQRECLAPRQQTALEKRLLDAAEKAGDTDHQSTILRRRFCRQGDAHTLSRLRQISGAHWPDTRALLFEELRSQKATDKLALMLAHEEDLSTLSALLQETADLDLLQRYEHLFFEERPDFVQQAYVHGISHYLNAHFGKQAADYARQYLAALVNKGHTALATQIAQALIDRFPERTYLPDELREAFPKNQRPKFTITNTNTTP